MHQGLHVEKELGDISQGASRLFLSFKLKDMSEPVVIIHVTGPRTGGACFELGEVRLGQLQAMVNEAVELLRKATAGRGGQVQERMDPGPPA